MNESCTEARIYRVCTQGGDVVQLATDCGEDAYGFTRLPFLKNVGLKYQTCSRLFAKILQDRSHRLFQNADSKMRTFLEEVLHMQKPEDNIHDFEGNLLDCMFAVIYLLDQPYIASQTCLILKPLQNLLIQPNAKIQFSDFCITWSYSESQAKYVMRLPYQNVNTYITEVEKCLQSKRFFISLIAMQPRAREKNGKRIGHAGALVYDNITGLLERFDPYEATNPIYNVTKLDNKLNQLFSKLPTFQEMITSPSLEIFKRKGLQYKQEFLEKEEEKVNDPQGFCVPWSILYMQARLSAPLQNPDSIPTVLQIWAEKKSSSLTALVRNFTKNLEKIKEEVYEQFFIDFPDHNFISLDYMYRSAFKIFAKHVEQSK